MSRGTKVKRRSRECGVIGEDLKIFARLLEAQEEERRRVAHELHDDVGAALAILGIDLLKVGQSTPGSAGQVPPDVAGIYEDIQAIAKRVSRLSHQLYSPALEYLGIAKAIQLECREFTERHGIPAACSCHGVPAGLDRRAGLSLLRVAQEALLNAAKHSGAAKLEVELMADASILTLVVRDDGRGFDVDQCRDAAGLGLICMRERMRLIGGDFEIRSQAGRGTEVVCSLPLEAATRDAI